MITSLHVTHLRSDVAIHSIKMRRDKVRYWFDRGGRIVGIWQTKTGKTRAVGHNPNGQTVIYRTMPANW